ncbi:hypothetical protein WJX79_005882 [Trebouxia sp. C0005]
MHKGYDTLAILLTFVLQYLWDVLNRNVPDKVFAEHGGPQTMPIAGSRTADTLGKRSLPAEVKDWVVH